MAKKPDFQLFTWVAEYKHGTVLREFEGDTESSFYSIDKDNVSRFYLEGPNLKAGFDTATGNFFVNETLITININGVPLTVGSSDIIQYKDAVNTFSPGNGASSTVIEKYNVGYKYSNGNESAQLILFIDVVRGKIGISVRFVVDIDGEAKLTLNGVEQTINVKKGVANTAVCYLQ